MRSEFSNAKEQPRWITSYQLHFALLSSEQIAKLETIFPSTIGRMLKLIHKQLGISTTLPPKPFWYRSVVPIKPKDWDVKTPGHFQCDTVAQCGTSLEGWTENFAIFTKSAGRVRKGAEITYSTPFSHFNMTRSRSSAFTGFAK